jgi:hypothetical protein
MNEKIKEIKEIKELEDSLKVKGKHSNPEDDIKNAKRLIAAYKKTYGLNLQQITSLYSTINANIEVQLKRKKELGLEDSIKSGIELFEYMHFQNIKIQNRELFLQRLNEVLNSFEEPSISLKYKKFKKYIFNLNVDLSVASKKKEV